MRAPTYQSQTNAPSGSQVRLAAPDTSGVGAGFARGLQSAARGIGDFAQAEFAIQERHNDIHARKLKLDWQREVQPLLSEYSNLQGEDAIARAGPMREQIAKLREDYAGRAGNERMKMLFEQGTEEDLLRFDGGIIDYSMKQSFKMELDVSAAELAGKQKMAASNWMNPLEHERSLADVGRASARISDLKGEPPELAKLRALEDKSSAHMAAMTAMASDPDFLEGDMMAYFDRFEGELTVDHANKARAALQVPIRNRWADGEFADIVSGVSSRAADADAGDGVSSSPATGTAPLQRPVDAPLGQGFEKHRARGSAGADYPAPAGTAIKPAAEGEVIEAGYGKTGGNFIRIRHADGSTTSYMHMGSPSPLKAGDRVTRSTVIGSVGSTGRSTGPHLHLEVKDASGAQVDPEQYLKGSIPLGSPDDPRQWDRVSIFGEIDRREADGSYTPEQAEYLRDRADKRIRRDEQMMGEVASAAKERAQAWLVENLESFTDISQMPADIRDDFTPAMTLQFMGIAGRLRSAQARAEAATAGPSASSYLNGLKTLSPDAFIEADLAEYAPMLTPAQFASYATAQAGMKQKREQGVLDYAPATTIKETISRMAKLDNVKVDGTQLSNTAVIMEQRANIFIKENGGKLPRQADYEEFYRYATAEVATRQEVMGGFLPDYTSTMPRNLISGTVSQAKKDVEQTRAARSAQRQRQRDTEGFRASFFRKNGRMPTALELDAGLANLEQ